MPNTFNDSTDRDGRPRYLSNKGTQTDTNLFDSKVISSHLNTSTVLHSTPRTPKLQRRRSLSVGSAPIYSSAAKNLLKQSPILPPPVPDSNESAKQVAPGEKSKNKDENNGDNAPKSLKRKYPQSLIDVCAEFARQEEELKEMHRRNKELGRYHYCPKLNFESTQSSENELELTDRSCNSTCICQKDKDNTTKDVTSSFDSKLPTDQSNNSTFLHDDTTHLDKSTASSSKAGAPENQPSDSASASNLHTSSASASKAPKKQPTKPQSSANNTATTSNLKKSGASFQPKHYTQVRPELSPQEKLFRHLREVNESGGDLDTSLIPDGCAMVYDPAAKYPVNISMGNPEESPTKAPRATPMSPDKFYYKPKPWTNQ